MEIKSLNKMINAENAVITMESGDRITIAFKDKAREYQVVNIQVQGGIMVVNHEQTDDALVVRRNSAQYVKG